jgi:hypothetical protein
LELHVLQLDDMSSRLALRVNQSILDLDKYKWKRYVGFYPYRELPDADAAIEDNQVNAPIATRRWKVFRLYVYVLPF